MKLIPFNLYAAEKPVRAVVHDNGRLEKFVLVHDAPPYQHIFELHTNN